MSARTRNHPVDSPFYMGGTENTGEYKVLLVLPGFARLGIRRIAGDMTRIRIETHSPRADIFLPECFPRKDGWKQPYDSGQRRFSIVKPNREANVLAAKAAWRMLVVGRTFPKLPPLRRR